MSVEGVLELDLSSLVIGFLLLMVLMVPLLVVVVVPPTARVALVVEEPQEYLVQMIHGQMGILDQEEVEEQLQLVVSEMVVLEH